MKYMTALCLSLVVLGALQPAIADTLKTVHGNPAVVRKQNDGALNTQPIPPGHSSIGNGSKPISVKPASKTPPAPHWDVTKNKGS